MRVKVYVIAAALVLAVAWSGVAFGAGFGLYEHSARGNALGGAMIGRADDPSALAYNPAGITQIEGEALMFGATFVMPAIDVDYLGQSTPLVDNTWIPPHFYYTAQVSDRLWWGVATYARYGLGTEFPESWPGRFSNYYAAIESASINPNIAWKMNDRFSLAIGVEAMWFEFEQKRKIGLDPLQPSQDYSGLNVKGDDWGWGWNLAAHYRPNDQWSLGITYHAEIDQTLTGTADIQNVGVFPARGSITLPESVGAGICYRPNKWVSYEVDAIWTGWSSYKELFLQIDNGLPDMPFPKDWEDTWRYQFGVEFQMQGDWQLRLGYVYDNTPVPDSTVDFMVPGSDRQIFSIGAGWTRGNWGFDFSYSYLKIDDRITPVTSPAGGAVFRDGDTDLIGFSVTYRF